MIARILIIGFFMSFVVRAQMTSVVYLKNGSAIRGEVLKNDSTGVSLRTRDGSHWNFSADEVQSIEHYSVAVPEKGYYNRTSAGLVVGDQLSGSFRVVNGYCFNRHWETGVGVGYETFWWNRYLPIFLEGRYNFLSGSTRPFISAHGGYEMSLQNREFNKGGITAGVEGGITHYFSNHAAISTSVGYRFAYLKQNNTWWDDYATFTQINRFEIRLGFVFR